ncbi:Microsomal glutathione S-transferase 3 [Coemansia sp. RSA 2399]|nr:Microsomal glutathione S-transferase 3 [Coemansia sp. RSA 2399]
MSVGAARKKYNVQYPDNGGGRYSDKLSDEDWEAFNNIKRASDNYLEQVGVVLMMLTMAGLYHPKLAASLGASYIVGRFVYTRGYTSAGFKGRMYGAPIMSLSLISLVITATYSAFTTTVLA